MILNKKRFIVLCHFCTQAARLAAAQEEIEKSMSTLNEKENEMGRLQTDLESAQREREEKERALMEAMANIHVKEHESEENDIGENGMSYGELSCMVYYQIWPPKNFLRCVNVKIQEIIVKIQTVAETSSFQHIHDFFVVQKVFCIHGIGRNLYSLQLVIWFHNVQLQTLGC